MFRNQQASRGVFAALLAGSVTLAAASNAAASGTATTATLGAAPEVQVPSHTVTLVTGDRVALADDGHVTVQYNANRKNISFTTYKQLGDVYAIPSDVEQMVLDGQLDPSLFDLTRLLAYGADTQSATDVIVQYASGSAAAPAATAARAAVTGPSNGGAKVTHRLGSVNATALRVPHATTSAFWNSLSTTSASSHLAKLRPGVRKLWLDQVLKPTDQQSTPQVGAPTAWAAGFDGTGETVGLVDTGVDATHPDLAGKVVAAQDFTTDGNTDDNVGHGTHVASIIAGTGAASGGAQKGVAPGAKIVSAKACTLAGCTESAIINAMQWVVTQPGVKVVNMSLGGAPSGGTDPLDQAVDNLTASNGVLFVVAAGNNGPGYGTVNSPGEADAALTVGAVDSSDAIASFSSRGPRIGDSALKPDITAPGVQITGACSSTGTFCGPGQTYVQLSGTSMATPHVAGGAAILAEAHPAWTPAQLKSALMGSADPNSALDTFTQGAGRLDLARGYAQPVLADPASVSLGLQTGQRSGYPTLTRTITYSNTSAAPLTLSLNLAVDDPTGAAAPSGMFSLSASSVTVPANGTASVTLTANLSVDGPVGRYSGSVTATSGGVRVVTPIGDEQESTYAVTANLTGRTGSAPTSFFVFYATAVGNSVFIYYTAGGGGQSSATVNLPPGDYMVWTNLTDVDAQGNQSLTLQALPQLNVNANQTIAVDARTAGPVNTSVPDSAAKLFETEVGVQFTPGGAVGPSVTYNAPASAGLYVGQLGPPNTFVYGFLSKVVSRLYDPGPAGDVANSPHTYQVGRFFSQQLPNGVTQNETAADLATVDAGFGAQQAGDSGTTISFAQPNQAPYFNSGAVFPLPVTLPTTQAQTFNTDAGVQWYGTFQENDTNGNDVNDLVSSLVAYTGGSTTTHVWNNPVYGPAFTTTRAPLDWVVRGGDTICADVPLTGDSSGDAGHPGEFTTASGSVALKLNGSVVKSQNYPNTQALCTAVPSAWSSGYELDANLQRTSGIQLSTNISASWTFSSATVDPNSILHLQLWAATFDPALNSADTAPAGVGFQIPVTALPQPGSAAAGLQSLTVDYSTDDGATWQPATIGTVNSQTGSYTATVTHPNITGFVSLRAHITDYAGNTATETIIHAYKIAPGA